MQNALALASSECILHQYVIYLTEQLRSMLESESYLLYACIHCSLRPQNCIVLHVKRVGCKLQGIKRNLRLPNLLKRTYVYQLKSIFIVVLEIIVLRKRQSCLIEFCRSCF